MLVDIFLIIRDNGLCNGLADGVDLGGVTTARDTDSDVDVGEFVEAEEEEGFVDLWEGQEGVSIWVGGWGKDLLAKRDLES